ncbi:hypothetical protein AVO41_03855 [Thiomicrospira sp. WB1]|nr:hypothetical protein AVO41_03855 [Thiomicrospira sp. WB1]
MAVASSAAFSVAPATAQAEVTGNISATSNYMWRGLTQSDNQAAIQGGIDYANDSGFYLGTWSSTVTFGGTSTYELDGYLGFSGETSGVEYDLGYVYYAYPLDDNANFSEVYGSIGMSGFTLGGAVSASEDWDDSETGDVYAYGSYGFDISENASMSILVGNQSYAEDGADSFTHGQISLSMEDFTFAVDQIFDDEIDQNEGDPVVSVMYSKSFGL